MMGQVGWTVLTQASYNGHVAVVRLVLRSMGGRGLDERVEYDRTALWMACARGHVDVVRALLLAGADHTIADNEGRTPQQVAQYYSYPECVALLQWWENELQRAYFLHKAGTLHDDAATRQQAPAAAVPTYLSPRGAMPSVEVEARQQDGQEGQQDEAALLGKEEMDAMVGYVVKDLAAELYTELLAALH